MKYIRTKDGRIIEVKRRRIVFPIFPAGETRTIFNDNILEKDVIKESDTIEELCDDYFAISNTNYKTPIKIDFEKKIIYQWQSNRLVVSYTFEQFIPYHTIYGAIWTDRGLIYVARMNNDGELELL